MWSYESEEDALRDVLRLSRGMTYKAACAGLSLGGGKAVIIAKPEQKSEAMFRAFGRFVQSLGGRYITAEDMNTCVNDMNNVRMETKFVTGIAASLGGSGDPSPVTALGVFSAMRAAIKYKLKKQDFKGLKVAIQGVGNVGFHLASYLHEAGAKVYATDLSTERLREVERQFGAVLVGSDEISSLDVDVFAPCAMGAILNSKSIPLLKAPIVCGAANNQLEDEALHGKMLQEMNITYCPDYVVNAGGLINVYNELIGYNREKALNEARNIEHSVAMILNEAQTQKITTHESSARFAERRIQSISKLRPLHNVASSPVGRFRSE